MKIAGLRLATAGVAAAALVTMTACSSGLGGLQLVRGGCRRRRQQGAHAAHRQRRRDHQGRAGGRRRVREGQPRHHVKTETRPGGTEGDNIVKTKLSTGDMEDVFWYNSGSLLQALNPAQTLVDLTNDPAIANVDPSFFPVVTQNGKVYGAPWGTAIGGGILYNKDVYSKLGLQVPKTWADFLANTDKIKAAGITPVIETFKAPTPGRRSCSSSATTTTCRRPTRTSPRTTPPTRSSTRPTRTPLKGFQKLAEVQAKGYVNTNFGSATQAQGMKLLAHRQGRHVPDAVERRRADPGRPGEARSGSSGSPVTTRPRPARRSGSRAAPTSPRRARTSTWRRSSSPS